MAIAAVNIHVGGHKFSRSEEQKLHWGATLLQTPGFCFLFTVLKDPER